VFDTLSDRLQGALGDLGKRGKLDDEAISKAMREIRLALLEADVNFRVVKSFTASVKERCLGEEVIGHLNPGQQVIKIVDEELTALMGGAVITEQVFNIPGVGRMLIQAVARRDYPVVQGVVMIVAGLYVLINLLVDLLYGYLDPRLRVKGG